MALINTSLPNLIQGVSQQPDALRYDGQCEEQENALSNVVEGLTKRPNTRHVARLLQSAISSNSFVHFIDRDDNEKYVVIHDGTKLRVFNLSDGTEGTINDATGGYTTTGSYLDTANPKSDVKALTIADNTILLNKTITVQKDTETSDALSEEALIFIKQSDYQKDYQLFTTNNDRAQVSVTITPVGGQYQYDFTVTSTGDGYRDTSEVGASDIKVYVGSPDGPYQTTATTTDLYPLGGDGIFSGEHYGLDTVASVTLDQPNLLIWEVEAPEQQLDYGAIGAQTPASTATDASRSIGANFIMGAMCSPTSGYDLASGITTDDRDLFHDHFTAAAYGHVGIITPTAATLAAGNIFLEASDGLFGEGLGLAYKKVSAITDLPARAPNNFKIKVNGDSELEQDDYYVKFETADGGFFGDGSWVEASGDEILTKIDADTFPVRLVNTAANTFTLEACPLSDRKVGDDTSNPFPSFIDTKIDGMFFFKNRLGLLSRENVILSEAGEFFNFFRTSVRSLLDSDNIDVSVGSAKVTSLDSAVGFQENLIMFGDSGQSVLKGGELLTPRTVSINPITNYTAEGSVTPLALGSYIYFPFSRGSHTGLREFSTSATTDTYDSVEVSDHVPRYIPNNIVGMTGTTAEDIIALLSSEADDTLFIYKYFWNGNQKVLSSWSKFSFEGNIRGIQFIDSTLYMVVSHNDETQLLEMPLESGLKDDAGYNTYLDQRIEDTVLSGNSTITLPYTPEDDSVQVYTKDGLKLSATNVGSTVTLAQPVSEDTDVWVGYPYTMKYTFSEQLFKASTGNSKSPSAASKLMVRNGALFFDDTAYFQVKVTPKARQTYVNTFTPDVVGSTTIGELNLDSGFYRFPVFTKAADTTITIENDSALPSNFQSAEFESFVHSRSNRYG